jgi:hypothetical protein
LRNSIPLFEEWPKVPQSPSVNGSAALFGRGVAFFILFVPILGLSMLSCAAPKNAPVSAVFSPFRTRWTTDGERERMTTTTSRHRRPFSIVVRRPVLGLLFCACRMFSRDTGMREQRQIMPRQLPPDYFVRRFRGCDPGGGRLRAPGCGGRVGPPWCASMP